MNRLPDSRIEDIGLTAARLLAGGRVEDIALSLGQDASDNVTYVLSFLYDYDPIDENAAILLTRTAQSIRDRLIAEGDEHYPIIRFLTREEWPRR